jgi:hypothetical protein
LVCGGGGGFGGGGGGGPIGFISSIVSLLFGNGVSGNLGIILSLVLNVWDGSTLALL